MCSIVYDIWWPPMMQSILSSVNDGDNCSRLISNNIHTYTHARTPLFHTKFFSRFYWPHSIWQPKRNNPCHKFSFDLFFAFLTLTLVFFVGISGSLLRFFPFGVVFFFVEITSTNTICGSEITVQQDGGSCSFVIVITIIIIFFLCMLLYNKTSPKLKTTWWISASRPKHAPKESINSV